MLTDPIADMLTRIRNALHAQHLSVEVPASRLKEEMARLLKREGFIVDYRRRPKSHPQGALVIELKYGQQKESIILGLERVSKPGCRIYVSQDRIPRVRNGLGMAVISTSQGVMSDREARKRRLGGEVLAKIW